MKHLKKTIPLCLLALVLVVGITLLTPTAHAATSGDFEYTVTDGAATVTKYTGTAAELMIPDTLDGCPVTTIGEQAFAGCESIRRITLPDSITACDLGAFASCYGLQDVCITDLAAWCSISFADFEASPLYYGENLFVNGQLVNDLVIPAGVTKIGDYAFASCFSLNSVTLSNGVTEIGQWAFNECENLQRVSLPGSLKTVGYQAFSYCYSLTSVNLPAGVTTLGNNVFSSCYALESVTIPAGVTAIGNSMFACCYSLRSITIPAGVTSIGNSVFYECRSLADVYFCGSQAQWESITLGYDNDPLSNATIHYNCAPTYLPGDINCNGEVTNDDVLLLMWHVLFPEENPILVNGDLNYDDSVDNNDVLLLIWHILFPEDNPL